VNNLQRRVSGIWVARLVVPQALRKAAGRREFVQTTGTHNATIAKLVAGALLLDWRRQLAALQMAHGLLKDMNDDVLRLIEGSPLLAHDGTVPLSDAERLSGVPFSDLLRAVTRGELKLFARTPRLSGHIVPIDALEPDEPESGRSAGVVIPGPNQMPGSAVRTELSGPLAIDDSAEIASEILATGISEVRLLAFAAPGRPGWMFVPREAFVVSPSRLEVVAATVDALRRRMASTVPPDLLDRAKAARETTARAISASSGKMAGKLFSQAVEAYCKSPDGLPGSLTSELEQGQRRKGLLLFSEFMGDMSLAHIDGDLLRRFRDGPLKRLPANANRLPKEIRRGSMNETLAALQADGRKWPTMTTGMQRERMSWLFQLFAWLHHKGYLRPDPAAPLRGETGKTKAERKAEARGATTGDASTPGADSDDDEGRGPFTPSELRSIFSLSHYQSGDGAHVHRRNQVWYPFEYWLPLLGLLAGCRIKEACQLHLSDVREVGGVWCLDINERTADKTLKNEQSRRPVPLHRQLVALGFLAYCERLRDLGYRRVFPELSYSSTDARYAKEPGRKMSAMLKSLGMPRDNSHVFHCLRHNANNALARVPMAALPFADEHLRMFIRYKVLGHKMGDDVNVSHYMSSPIEEAAALVNAVDFDLPEIKPFDVASGVEQVKLALGRKQGVRKGREDMGPLLDVPEPKGPA
jgi:integrase